MRGCSHPDAWDIPQEQELPVDLDSPLPHLPAQGNTLLQLLLQVRFFPIMNDP